MGLSSVNEIISVGVIWVASNSNSVRFALYSHFVYLFVVLGLALQTCLFIVP